MYGESKARGEEAVTSSGAPHIVLRTGWVYGPRGANFPRTMLRLARERSELRVVDDQVGAPTSAIFLAKYVALLPWCLLLNLGGFALICLVGGQPGRTALALYWPAVFWSTLAFSAVEMFWNVVIPPIAPSAVPPLEISVALSAVELSTGRLHYQEPAPPGA